MPGNRLSALLGAFIPLVMLFGGSAMGLHAQEAVQTLASEPFPVLRGDGTPVAGALGPMSGMYRDDWSYNIFVFQWDGRGRLYVELESRDPKAQGKLLVAVVGPDTPTETEYVRILEPTSIENYSKEKKIRLPGGVRLKRRIEDSPVRPEPSTFFLYIFQRPTEQGQYQYPPFRLRLVERSRWKFWQWGWKTVGATFRQASCEGLDAVKITFDALPKRKIGPVTIEWSGASLGDLFGKLRSAYCPQGEPPKLVGQQLDHSEWPLMLLGENPRLLGRSLRPQGNEITAQLKVGSWFPRAGTAEINAIPPHRFTGKGQFYDVWVMLPGGRPGGVTVGMTPREGGTLSPRIFLHDKAWGRINKEGIYPQEPTGKQWSFTPDSNQELPFFVIATSEYVGEEGPYEVWARLTEAPPLDRQKRAERAHELLGGLEYLLACEDPSMARWRGKTLYDLADEIEGIRTVGFGVPEPPLSPAEPPHPPGPPPTTQFAPPGVTSLPSGGTETGPQQHPGPPIANPNNVERLRKAIRDLRERAKSHGPLRSVVDEIRDLLLEQPQEEGPKSN